MLLLAAAVELLPLALLPALDPRRASEAFRDRPAATAEGALS
jgi:hypothetical protein